MSIRVFRPVAFMAVFGACAVLTCGCGRSDEPPPDDTSMQNQPPVPTQQVRQEIPLDGKAEVTSTGDSVWKKINYKDGHCTVMMPGTPRLEQQKMGNAPDALMYTLTFEDATNQERYTVTYADRPKNATIPENVDEFLKGMLNAAATNLRGIVTENKQIAVGPYKGREITADLRDGGLYKSRMILVGDRQYQLIIIAANGKTVEKNAEKFFGSFGINEQ